MNSQDEPAVQVALVNAIVKLLAGVVASIGLNLGVGFAPALTAIVTAIVAALWSIVQGYLTRSKVYAPATVEQIAPGVTGDPTLDVPLNR